ncbi:MAG: M20 family metallopeptidase, partial [Bacteroidota bacterium]
VFVEKISNEGKNILVVTFRPNHRTPIVFLNGHLDVVPADLSQFLPVKKGGRLYGRGSYDMKGGCAVMIGLIEYFAREKQKPDVGFMFVSDEEFSGASSRFLYEQGYCPKLFIPVEPTNLDLVIETKGILWMEGTISGLPAHGSMPWLGKNPIEIFHRGLEKFYKLFPPLRRAQWRTSANLGEVHSGDCYNRVPPELNFKIDVRYVPDEDPSVIVRKIKSCFSRQTLWKIDKCQPPHPKAKDMTLIQQLQSTGKVLGFDLKYTRAPFCTDARFFAAGGIPSVVFGPKGADMHGDQEYVDLRSLQDVYSILRHFLVSV